MNKFLFFWISLLLFSNWQELSAQNLPLPSDPQIRWQQYEQIMFVCMDPCTWQGREYDNHSLPLSRINPTKLNTDQWCETASLWGAKLILFVAKHTGGFCWWQTETSNYGIKETPWKNGKGDVLAELSKSCKKYGLDLGVYIYPGDDQWGAGIGSGGTTKDPAMQERYNKVFRNQLTEVLSRYGMIREVWFDGNCNIPVKDILIRYVPDAVIFQGKSATIRWVGNEDGYAPDPNWYTLDKEDMRTGVSTSIHSNPDGDAYAPVEVDVPLLKNGGHKWFWAPNTDNLLLNTGQLMDIYYKSVGRGAVLLLNSTPDTTGLIPASHVAAYKKFGEEMKDRFLVPLKRTSGKGEILEMHFKEPTEINHVILQEELDKGQRVRAFVVEGYAHDKWTNLCEGSSVGNKKIDQFPAQKIKKIRVRFTDYKMEPQIKNFAVYRIGQITKQDSSREDATKIGSWEADHQQWKEVRIDLTKFVTGIGQYEICFSPSASKENSKAISGIEFSDCRLEMYGREAPESIQGIEDKCGFRLTRSQQTLDEFPTILTLKIRNKSGNRSGDVTLKRITY